MYRNVRWFIRYWDEKLIIFNTCGVLENKIYDISIIVSDSAVKDEGTSYHHQAVPDEIAVNYGTLDDFVNYLGRNDLSYTVAK